ncbi:MAG TPA: hypothetical protein VGI78_12560 [Acetobacteraceae bacterium]
MTGNGVDIAAVSQLLREVADRVIAHDDRFAAIDRRFAAMQLQMDHQFAEVRSDVAELRHTLTPCHASVLGHGILISELERRVLRIEDHLHLPPVADI